MDVLVDVAPIVHAHIEAGTTGASASGFLRNLEVKV